ncbi:hypothetical protein [Hyphobacterium sp.]|uniref:hypothetical protein n=1 Tax=Hyphobacterium sp. TaxID=2004662 RepID=UPI003BACA02E
MAYSIQFPETGNITEFRLRRVVTLEDISRLNDGLYFSPDWRKGMNCLGIIEAGTDLSEISPEVMRDGLRREAERLRTVRGPDFKMAWVIEDAHNLPIVQLWAAMPFLSGLYELRVFREEEEARAWLVEFDHGQGGQAAE